MARNWRRCTKAEPCPICEAQGRDGANSYCKLLADGAFLCMKSAGVEVPGFRRIGRVTNKGGQVYRYANDPGPAPDPQREAKKREREAEEEKYRKRAQNNAVALWKGANMGGGGRDHPRARAYFAARGIDLALLPPLEPGGEAGHLPPSIRFHPTCRYELPRESKTAPFRLARYPAVVGAVQGPDGKLLAVQRIFLDDQQPTKRGGLKDNKKTLGPCSTGAVRLGRADAGGVLILTEGIETGLAVLAAVCRGRPGPAVWACLSTSGLMSLELPASDVDPQQGWIRRVVIAADHDPVDPSRGWRPGMQFARILANRLAHDHPHLRVEIAPPTHAVAPTLVGPPPSEADEWGECLRRDADGKLQGADWLDVLNEAGVEAVRRGVLELGVVIHEAGSPPPPAPPSGGGSAAAGGGSGDGRGGDQEIVPQRRTHRAQLVLQRLYAPPPEARAGSSWTIRRWGGRWWMQVPPHRGRPRWREVADEWVRARVLDLLDTMWTYKRNKLVPFAPSDQEVGGVLSAMIAYTTVPAEDMPVWLPASFDQRGEPLWDVELGEWSDTPQLGPIRAESVIAFANGLLDADEWVKGGRPIREIFHPWTPRWFTRTCLPWALPLEALEQAERDADGLGPAELLGRLCPTWLNFLAEALEGSQACIDTLQQWLGYCLTSDIAQQKILWLQGDPGTGKGTIREGLSTALGEENVGHTDLDRLAGRFEIGSLVGRTLILIPELQIDRFTPVARALTVLKSWSGGDPQPVEDKHVKTKVNVRMTGKFMITPNGGDETKMRDASAALIRRLLVIPMRHKPEREDPTLQDRIRAEGLGIALWGLYGLRELRRRGHFVQPPEGEELKQAMRVAMSPLVEFVEDWCLVGPQYSVETTVLYKLYVCWAKEQGHTQVLTESQFGTQLRAAVVGGVARKQHQDRGVIWREYHGLRCRLEGEDPANPFAQRVVHEGDVRLPEILKSAASQHLYS